MEIEDQAGKTQGVPKETPQRNVLGELQLSLKKLRSEGELRHLTDTIISSGYFEKSLLEQVDHIIDHLMKIPEKETVVRALIYSENDKVRSLGVHLNFSHFGSDLNQQLKFLYQTGAMPGTWTQETSQGTLKNVIHSHGLDRVLPKVSRWAGDNNPNIRRMLIEALRPRGVWCKHLSELKADPSPLKPLLEKVLDDPSDYVQKAAANCINDISKDNPETVVKWVKEWRKGEISDARKWIIERGLRTLVKENHPDAQKLLGLGSAEKLNVKWEANTPQQILINQAISFSLQITNAASRPAKARLQLLMKGPGKNAKLRESKYLLGTLTLKAGESKAHSKEIKFAHKNSVRKLPGKYHLELFCNGKLIESRTAHYYGHDSR